MVSYTILQGSPRAMQKNTGIRGVPAMGWAKLSRQSVNLLKGPGWAVIITGMLCHSWGVPRTYMSTNIPRGISKTEWFFSTFGGVPLRASRVANLACPRSQPGIGGANPGCMRNHPNKTDQGNWESKHRQEHETS